MEARGKVLMKGDPLEHAFTFTYLGYDFRADGKAEHAIEERMRKHVRKAALRFSRMCHIWRSKELDTTSSKYVAHETHTFFDFGGANGVMLAGVLMLETIGVRHFPLRVDRYRGTGASTMPI